MRIESDGGLLLDTSGEPNRVVGYIYNFQGHGAFAPNGKVTLGDRELEQAEIDKHNQLLAKAEWEAMIKHGRGILYLVKKDDRLAVQGWIATQTIFVYHEKRSFHNMAGRNGRHDVWFMLDGSRWHGVNIGDNQICRVRRCKK